MATGGCLCGAVRYEVRGPLRDVLICHCTECRRWSGHLFAATAAARADFHVVGERGLRWIARAESDTGARRGFCCECGTSRLRVMGHVYVGQAGDYYDAPLG